MHYLISEIRLKERNCSLGRFSVDDELTAQRWNVHLLVVDATADVDSLIDSIAGTQRGDRLPDLLDCQQHQRFVIAKDKPSRSRHRTWPRRWLPLEAPTWQRQKPQIQ